MLTVTVRPYYDYVWKRNPSHVIYLLLFICFRNKFALDIQNTAKTPQNTRENKEKEHAYKNRPVVNTALNLDHIEYY